MTAGFKRPTIRRSRHGGILSDTLVVVVIIILLTLIAFPVYRNRDRQAKVARANEEIVALAEAENQVARLHGFYVPLQMLDDLAADPATRTLRTDDLANEPAGIRLIDASAPADSQIGHQLSLRSDDARVAALVSGWRGPFHQSKRVYLSSAGAASSSGLKDAPIARDYPLDPWGNPYRCYSPAGIIGTSAAESSPAALDSDTFSDGVLTTQDDRFDVFAIVSYGPDGQSDSNSLEPKAVFDDLIYMFEPKVKRGL